MITSTHYHRLAELAEISLPIRLHEKPAHSKTLGLVGSTLAFAAIVVAPPVLVSFLHMAANSQLSTMANPGVATGAMLTFVVGASLFLFLVWNLLNRISRRRVVTINSRDVVVRNKSLFKLEEWREPLSSYVGIERKSRATIGGWQHKLVLSHSDPARDVAVWSGSVVPSGLIGAYETVLSSAR